MNNDTTVASNDESSKKTTGIKVANTNEMKTNYVSDEEVRNDIKNKWGEEVYVAAIDAEFIENIIAQEDAANSSTSEGGRRKRVKVTSKVAIALNHLINNPLVTIGAKEEKGKFKNARQNAKKDKKIQEAKQQEQEK